MRLERKIYVAASIQITPMHSMRLHILIEHARSILKHLPTNSDMLKDTNYLSVVRDQYGGWCMTVSVLERKELIPILVLPLCCRFSFEPLIINSQQAAASLQPNDLIRNAAGMTSPSVSLSQTNSMKTRKIEQMETMGSLLSSPGQTQDLKKQYVYLLNVDGINMSFKTDPASAALLQHNLAIAYNEVVGEFSQDYGSSRQVEDVIKNRMLSLRLFDAIHTKCELQYKKIFATCCNNALSDQNDIMWLLQKGKDDDVFRIDTILWFFRMALMNESGRNSLYDDIIIKGL